MPRPRRNHRMKSIKVSDFDLDPYSYGVQLNCKRDQNGDPILDKKGKRVYQSTLKKLKTDVDSIGSHILGQAIPSNTFSNSEDNILHFFFAKVDMIIS